MIFNLMDYVVQWRGANGEWPASSVSNIRSTRESDPLIWRRHDWGTPDEGYQIGDAFLSDDSTYAVTTWSYPPFGPFAQANGDGGEVYVSDGFTMRIAGTQDGGSGNFVQFFPGPQYGALGGWIAFRADAPTGSWASVVAELQDWPDPNETNLKPNPSFTRYRLENVTVPWKFTTGWSGEVAMPAIISQHFNGADMGSAIDMEESVWMLHIGRVWYAYYRPHVPDETVAMHYRIPKGIPPFCGVSDLPGWGLQDARLYTNVRQHDGTVTGANYGWPPRKSILQLIGRA